MVIMVIGGVQTAQHIGCKAPGAPTNGVRSRHHEIGAARTGLHVLVQQFALPAFVSGGWGKNAPKHPLYGNPRQSQNCPIELHSGCVPNGTIVRNDVSLQNGDEIAAKCRNNCHRWNNHTHRKRRQLTQMPATPL